MSHENISRRAILAGAAISLPTIALPAIAIAATEPDPILAAIEAHREAQMRWMISGRIWANLFPSTPEFDAAEKAHDADVKLRTDAEDELVDTRPTTIAGVLALLAYVDDFHCQAFAHPEDPTQWCSDESCFRDTRVDHKILDRLSGKPIELPFTVWIMRNARLALSTLAVRP